MSPDPLADAFHGWSPYNYVLNNPLGLVDPDGMAPNGCCRQEQNLGNSLRYAFGWFPASRFDAWGTRQQQRAEDRNEAMVAALRDSWELNVAMPAEDIGRGVADLAIAENFHQVMDATLVVVDGVSDLSATGTLVTLPLAKLGVPQAFVQVGTVADGAGVVISGINAVASDGEWSGVGQRSFSLILNYGTGRLTQFMVARQSNRLVRQVDPEAAGAAVSATVGVMTNQRDLENH